MTTSASETETLELDPAVLTEPPQPDRTDHLARCASCAFTVRFKPLQSGHGFMLVGSEESLGIGEDGRPTCLNGHGQMEIADDQLPAAEAFALAQEQLQDQRPPRLPFPAPPFNYEGALHEIFEKQSEITRLEIKFTDADERRKKAKSALDDAREELGKMIDVIREREEDRLHDVARREADAEAGHVDGTNLVRCTWEEQHPGETCIICADTEYAGRYFNGDVAPRDSVRHIDQADGWALDREVNSAIDALDNVGIIVTSQVAMGWSSEERAAVTAWAMATEDGRLDSTVTIPERPKVLGTGHVAGEGRDGEPQRCTQCDAVLTAGKVDGGFVEGEEPNYYEPNVLVGTDCPGRAKADGQHYPEKRKGGRKKKPAAE
jgi:hypothetical protein